MGLAALVTFSLTIFSIFYSVKGYSISYQDCNTVDSVNTYQLNKLCSNNNHEELNNNTETITILQKRTVQKLSGYRCTVRESCFRFYCGAYSHLKLATPPEIEQTYAVSDAICWGMITSNSFTTPSGHRVAIRLGKENIIHSTNAGVIKVTSNAIACQGQT